MGGPSASGSSAPASSPSETPIPNPATPAAHKVSTAGLTAGIPTGRFTKTSIADSLDMRPTATKVEEKEALQLTQESLEKIWHDFLEKYKDDKEMYSLLADKKIELKNNNLFNIQVPNIYLDTTIRQYQTRILSFMKEATSNKSLTFKVVVVFEHVAKKAYLPSEKFDEMVSHNPAMLSLRKMFTDIDF